MCCRSPRRNWLRLPPRPSRHLRAQVERLLICNPVQKVIASSFPLEFIPTPLVFLAVFSAVSGWRSSPVSKGRSPREVCGIQANCQPRRLRPLLPQLLPPHSKDFPCRVCFFALSFTCLFYVFESR